jgi:hypothetical protein
VATEAEAARAEVVVSREAALAEVIASREAFSAELVRLEASGRAAVDIKAKVRRNPARAAGLVASAGFLAVGGPGKVARGTRRVLRGRKEPLPPSLLPEDVDRALRALGDDGTKVRGALERDFADYLDKRKPDRGRHPFRTIAGTLATGMVAPVGQTLVKRLLGQMAEVNDANVRKTMSGIRSQPAAGTPGAQPPGAKPPDAKPPAAR